MKKLVIFLDIDGVLNCRKTICKSSLCIDKELLSNYETFITEIAKRFTVFVVLCSSWRNSTEHLTFLESYDVWCDDMTSRFRLSGTRSLEILDYLVDHPDIDPKYCIILDDMVTQEAILNWDEDLKKKGVQSIPLNYDTGFDTNALNYAKELLKNLPQED